VAVAASSSSADTSAPTSHAVDPTTDIGPNATGPPAYISATASVSPPAAAIAAVAVIRSDHERAPRPITTAANAPAAAGTRNSASQPADGCCGPGVASSSGSPGSGPRTTENSDTLVPVPSANPGPASTAITHSAAFGTSATSTRNSPVSPAVPPPICCCVPSASSACATTRPAASSAAAPRKTHSATTVPRTAAGSQGASSRGISSLIAPAAPTACPASAISIGYSTTCAYSGDRPLPALTAAMPHAHTA